MGMAISSGLKKLWPLLPILGLYIVVILVFSSDDLIGDEFRHVYYADNIINGFYTDANNPELLNGPGYPLVLVPFLALNAGFLFLKLLNAIFVFVGIVYFKKTLEFFLSERYALILAILVGLYPPLLRFMPLIYSEPLTFMIVCALSFHIFKLCKSEHPERKQIAIVSCYIGFLILVKIIFLQVILLSILLLGVVFLLYKNKKIIRLSMAVAGGFLLTVPYILYAYSLTGKPLYLGTGGGEILYHRSTPFENEWGNWFSSENVLNGGKEDYQPDSVYKDLSQLSENHLDVYLKMESLNHMERDSAFKAIAIQNMKTHPKKYVKNTISNLGRFVFHYPFSYRNHSMSAYGYMIPNMFIVVLWLLSLYPFVLARKKIPFELKAIMLFYLIYASAIVLLDGRGRNFIIMVPSLVLFFSYVYVNALKSNLFKQSNS